MKRPPTLYDYVDSGPAIYVDSFATIRAEADLSGLPADAEKVAVRMIHGTGQVDLAQDLVIHPGLVTAARGALEAGAPIPDGSLADVDGVLLAHLREVGHVVAVVRPDGYLFGASGPEGAADLLDGLRRTLALRSPALT